MKWLLALLLSTGAWAQGPMSGAAVSPGSNPEPREFPIISHQGGLVTFYSPARIGPQQTSVLLNGYLDADQGVVKRNGYTKYGTLPGCTGQVMGVWPYTSLAGVNYMFAACVTAPGVGTLFNTNGGGTFNVIGSTFNAGNPIRATRTLGYIWFADGNDAPWYSDGVHITSTSMPIGSLIGTFYSRVVLANISGSQSSVELSGYENGTDFTLPAVILDTTSAIFPLNGQNDTRQVTCMFDGFKDVLYIWNEGQMWALYGSGNSSFYLRIQSNEIGCVEQGSVQEYDGKLHWLSKRGIEEFDGTNIRLISWPIQDLVQTLVQTSKNTQNLVIGKTQASWNLGNLTAAGAGAPLSSSVSPGNLVPSVFISSQVTGSDFGAGTLVNLSTSNAANLSLYISSGTVGDGVFGNLGSGWSVHNNNTTTSDGEFLSAGFSNNGATASSDGDSITITCPKNSNGVRAASCLWEDYVVGQSNSSCVSRGRPAVTINVFDSNNTDTQTQAIPTSTCNFSCDVSDQILNLQNASGPINLCFIGLTSSLNGDTDCGSRISEGWEYTRASVNQSSGFNAIFDASSLGCQAFATGGSPQWRAHYISTISNIRISSYSPVGIFTGPTFDTTFSTPIFAGGQISTTVPSNTTISFEAQGSNDGTNWTSTAAWGNGVQSTFQQRYWRYVSTLTTSVGWTTPSIQSALQIAESTGIYISQCQNPGTGISSWGNFAAVTLPSGGSFTFYVSTGSSCQSVQVATAPWQSQPNNTTVNASTAPYIGVKAVYSLSIATEAPSINNINISFTNGTARPLMASTTYNKRWYLAFSSNTSAGSYNDHVLVYDTRGLWSLLDDIDASALNVYGLKLYTGDSQTSGNIYLQDQGLSDNGNLFTFDLQTPDIDFGHFYSFKTPYDLFIEAAGTTNLVSSATINVNYYIDGSTIPLSLGSFPTYTPERKYSFARQSFPLDNFGGLVHTIRLEYTNAQAAPVTIYQSLLRYLEEPIP